MGIVVTPQAVETVLKTSTPNNTEIGKKIQDAPDKSQIPDTNSNADEVSQDEFNSYVGQNGKGLTDPKTPLDTKQKEAVWNGIKIEAGVEKEKELTKDTNTGDAKAYKEAQDKVIQDFRADTDTAKNGKIVDPEGRLTEIDESRGKIHAQIRELQGKESLSDDDKNTLKLLQEQRDKADSISKTFIATNGASIRINNASAIYELGRGNKQTLDDNYKDVPGYSDTEAAYEAYKAQYRASTGQDFVLRDNQSLLMYRRGDILAYRLIQSDLKDDTNGSAKQRVTGISDEFSFHIHDKGAKADDRTDDKVSIQIPKENPQESNIKDQGINQFTQLPGFNESDPGKQKPELGFIFYSQAETDTAVTQNSTRKTDRKTIDINLFNDDSKYSNTWLDYFLTDGGTITDANKYKDKDKDGIPDALDPNPGS